MTQDIINAISNYISLRAAIRKYHSPGGLTSFDCLIDLEARRPRSRCWQDWFLPRAEGLFQASPQVLVACWNLWYSSACRSITSVPAFIFTWWSSCVPVYISLFHKDTSPIELGAHPSLAWPHWTLITSATPLFPSTVTFLLGSWDWVTEVGWGG